MQSEIDLLLPHSLPEALEMLSSRAPAGKPLAGGTNLVVELRDGHHHGKSLVNLTRLQELRGIERSNGHVLVGAGATITELLAHPLIAQYGLPIKQSAVVFANPLVRNRATLGGNLVDASPAADMAPPLLVLDAEVELVSRSGVRWVRLEDFIIGVRRTVIQPDELMRSVRWALPALRSASAFYKLGLRKADAISVLSAAVHVACDEGGRCTQARIALGALAPTPLRAHAAELSLLGQSLEPARIAQAAQLAAQAARPISDIRGSAAFRLRSTEVIVRRLLSSAASALQEVSR